MAERKLRVTKPRLRSSGPAGKEVRVPAYERMRGNARMGARVRDIVLRGVSMRKYAAVLPEVAGTVGVSKSAVSSGATRGGPIRLNTNRAAISGTLPG